MTIQYVTIRYNASHYRYCNVPPAGPGLLFATAQKEQKLAQKTRTTWYEKPVPPTDSDLRKAVLARCTYNPRTGELLRKAHIGVVAGTPVGSPDTNGRLQATITVNGCKARCQVDHLIWLLHYGKRPYSRSLVHVDGDVRNNRIDNLREKTPPSKRAFKYCLEHGLSTGGLGKRCRVCSRIQSERRVLTPEQRRRLSEKALKRLGPKQFSLFKRCSRCGQKKGIDAFQKNKEKGRHAYCRPCATESVRDWGRANPGRRNANCSKSRAAKFQRTPSWADLDAIASIYEACPPGYEVDHIIPLRGKVVSGLHVPKNLQYLTKSENSSKQNRFEPAIEEPS